MTFVSSFQTTTTQIGILRYLTRWQQQRCVVSCVAATRDGHTTITTNESTDKLIEWLETKSGFSSLVAVDTNNQGLRGLYATKDIKSGQIIVAIPYSSALLVGDSTWARKILDDCSSGDDNTVIGDGWSTDDLEDVYQGLDFLNNFVGNVEYSQYVNSLPSMPKNGDDEAGLTPDFWNCNTISGLEVPAFVDQIQRRKQIVEQVAKRNNVNEDELRWVTFLIRSRRMTTLNMIDDPYSKTKPLFGVFPLRQKKIEQIQGYLIPLIDMANHAINPNACLKISINLLTRAFDTTSSFVLKALRPIKKGEEVTITYGEGDETSLYLLDKYGFFVEDNEADKKIDWKYLNPQFTTSLEEDRAELVKLEQLSPDSKLLSKSASSYSESTRTMLTFRIMMKHLSKNNAALNSLI